MQRFTDVRDEASTDEIWVVEHDPVFTLGQAGKPEHVLMPGDIPALHVDRGGQVTYHGPGQIVVDPLLDLKRLKISSEARRVGKGGGGPCRSRWAPSPYKKQ